MTADLTASAERLAANARPRDELLAELTAKPAKRWVVIRQSHIGGEVVDTVESRHRFGWVAEIVARRQTSRSASSKHGAYFDARRADS
jgi:hypothetical protein